ncbi:SPOR domain-containing protein [Alkalimonas sp. MEB108]|uniref:SPOR domain-containing protein n=1 Tax=Alkalimonas cellulosilytica TaxID=3058395 RepID=A0ABU7J543_9GAMM|nr:SPOR domain-containing protein [Alkalimonas sp. MEB108]MEE2001626.1 SPOR domain-containing protein [Alkalimonas sp. MEB108]
MTRAFKQRLLGACILMIAAVVFLPDLLDGEKQVLKDDFEQIPARPEFQGVQEQQLLDSAAVIARREQALAEPTLDIEPADADTTAETQSRSADSDELPSQAYAQVTVGESSASLARPATAVAETSSQLLTERAWTVRVGSFGRAQNAEELVTRLNDAGFRTYTRQVTNSQGVQLTSVFVGPDLRREVLEQRLTELRTIARDDRLVISNYQPLENN